MTAFRVLQYDEDANVLGFSADAQAIRSELSGKYQLVPMWVSFSVGVECLLKAVLCKHKCLEVQKGKVTSKPDELNKHAANYVAARRVYDAVTPISVTVRTFDWLKTRVESQGVERLFDFNSGTLGNAIGRLGKLVARGIVSADERWQLHNALQVLLNVRRNVDAHTFYGITVGGSINGDLENLYLPAVNLLLDVYNRAET